MEIPRHKILHAARGMASRLRRRNREWAKVVKLPASSGLGRAKKCQDSTAAPSVQVHTPLVATSTHR